MTLRSIRVYPQVITREVNRSGTTRQVLQPLAGRATRAAQRVASERVSRQTGLYQRSFKSSVEPGRGNQTARIVTENSAPYAGYIEAGTRPHVMPRKTAGVYVFQADHGGTVFTRGPIKHPGTEAQRVIEVALKRVANGGLY